MGPDMNNEANPLRTETFCPLMDTFYVKPVQPASFHELWTAYARDVYRFAVFLTGNTALAEDLTSESFLRVWTAWDRVAWQLSVRICLPSCATSISSNC